MQIPTPPCSWKLYFSNWLICWFLQSYSLWSSHTLCGSFFHFFCLTLYFLESPHPPPPPEVCCPFNLFEIHLVFLHSLFWNCSWMGSEGACWFSLIPSTFPSLLLPHVMQQNSVITDSRSLASLSFNFLGKRPAVKEKKKKQNKTCWNGV